MECYGEKYKIRTSIFEIEGMFKNITEELSLYIKANNIKSLVIGISGGVDSALTGLIGRFAIEQYKLNDVRLIPITIPIHTKDEELNIAVEFGSYLSNNFQLVDLTSLFDISLDHFSINYEQDEVDLKIAKGNLKARLRMMQLFNTARENKGMVLSTDNLTELLLGFWTLHGDVGNYGPIQKLWKTEVYLMASYLFDQFNPSTSIASALEECINAEPTDGLGITDTDLDQMGDVESYEEVDKILSKYMNSGSTPFIIGETKIPKVIEMYEATHFKRNDPFNIPRGTIVKGL